LANSIESKATTVVAAAATARASFAAVSLDRAAARIRAFEFLDDPATAGLRAVKLGGGPDHRTAQLPPTKTSRSLFSLIRNLFGGLIGGLYLFIYFFFNFCDFLIRLILRTPLIPVQIRLRDAFVSILVLIFYN